MLVVGENAAAYAMTRAIVGASTWHRVATVIEEIERNKAALASRLLDELRRRLMANSVGIETGWLWLIPWGC